MPVQYTGILEEHRAVRERAGLFDLSHMGELFVEGPEAGAALADALVSDPPALAVGRAHYSMICAPDGGILDDLIVYRLAEERFLVVANASNARVVSDALAERLGRLPGDPRRPLAGDGARRRSRARARWTSWPPLTDVDLGALRYYAIAEGDGRRASRRSSPGPATPARTASRSSSRTAGPVELWDALLAAGARAGLVPVGLGARDTLRLEAGMPLYGNELDRPPRPVRGGPRPGRQARPRRATSSAAPRSSRSPRRGPRRRLVGLVVRGRGIARHGYPVCAGERRDRAS